MTIEPPTANDPTSNPNIFNNSSPKKTKSNISRPDSNVAFSSFIPPCLSLILISNGIEPTMSMIANSVNVTVSRSSKFQSIAFHPKVSKLYKLTCTPAITLKPLVLYPNTSKYR